MDNSDTVQKYFNEKSWYYPIKDFDDIEDSELNEYEVANLEMLMSLAETKDPTQKEILQQMESETVEDILDSSETSKDLDNETINNWLGMYETDEGQRIEILSANKEGVILKFIGYSEEGEYEELNELYYKNGNILKVSNPYYFNGQLKEEEVYTLTADGILVEILPSGGWKAGMYKRIENSSGYDVKKEIISGYYTEPNNEIRLSISIYTDPEDSFIGEIEYDYGFGYEHYYILDSDSSIYQLINSMANPCGSLEVLEDNYIVLEIFGDETTYHCEEEYVS